MEMTRGIYVRKSREELENDRMNSLYYRLPNRLVQPNSEESPSRQEMGDDQGCVLV